MQGVHMLAHLVFSISLSAASASISLCVSGRQLALAPLVVRLRVVCMRVWGAGDTRVVHLTQG